MGGGFGGALVVVQLAVTLVLPTGVGLMVRDFQQRQAFEPGYDPSNMAVFSVGLDQEPYTTGAQRIQFINRLMEELEASPTIGSAGATTMFPRHRGNTLAQVEPQDQCSTKTRAW